MWSSCPFWCVGKLHVTSRNKINQNKKKTFDCFASVKLISDNDNRIMMQLTVVAIVMIDNVILIHYFVQDCFSS